MSYSKGEIAKNILLGIAGVGAVALVVALPGIAMISLLFPKEDSRAKFRVDRSLKSLEKNKYVRRYKKNGEDVIEITKKGKRRILQYKFEDMKIGKPKKWDGLWRIVIFDIPEKKRNARIALNMKLKELEFYPLQKSVFVLPYECRSEIEFIGEFFGIKSGILYIEARNIEKESKLKRKFKL